MEMYSQKMPQIYDFASVFMRKVYMWMSFGLLVTGVVAWYIGHDENLINTIFTNSGLVIGLFIFQIAIVVVMSFLMSKLSATVLSLLFMLYAFTLGITMSAIFVVYEMGDIYNAFVTAAGMFLAMSIYGTVTKRDLTGLGSFLFMGLVGLIIASIVNLFLKNSMLDFVISCIGVVVFVGLTAYDTQKLRNIANDGDMDDENRNKFVIMGALTLYLDFINLFLYLLKLFGRKR